MLLERINQPMPVYLDCTMGELLVLAGISLVACLLIGGSVFSLAFSRAGIGLCLAVPISFLVTPMFAKALQLKKVGKPQGYYQQSARLWLEDKRLLTTPYLRRAGPWSTRVIR